MKIAPMLGTGSIVSVEICCLPNLLTSGLMHEYVSDGGSWQVAFGDL